MNENSENGGRRKVVLVTGMSGAGRTSALKGLEDLGYEAVDNLPLSLLGNLVRPPESVLADRPVRPLAVGVDIRTRDFGVDSLMDEIDRLFDDDKYELRTLFLDCDDAVLVQRFTETRRRHPLDSGRAVPDMIDLERRMLAPLRARADVVIDTSDLNPWEMRQQVGDHFSPGINTGLRIFVTSFAYPRGMPREADLVFDVRFLRNPHYDPALRSLTGEDVPVQDAIRADPDFESFFDNLWRMLEILLPRYEKEGKSYLTIAIGCTGGRHRSVFIARLLADVMETADWNVRLRHRELQADEDGAAHGGRAD